MRFHVFNDYIDLYFDDYKEAEHTARLNACTIIDMDSGDILAIYKDDYND